MTFTFAINRPSAAMIHDDSRYHNRNAQFRLSHSPHDNSDTYLDYACNRDDGIYHPS
ncbi:MAG: hypothetical protein HGB19_04010 [Chlorobiales bacterium]|nr:hypothetical protein [Chlorobiales bacterium]